MIYPAHGDRHIPILHRRQLDSIPQGPNHARGGPFATAKEVGGTDDFLPRKIHLATLETVVFATLAATVFARFSSQPVYTECLTMGPVGFEPTTKGL